MGRLRRAIGAVEPHAPQVGLARGESVGQTLHRDFRLCHSAEYLKRRTPSMSMPFIYTVLWCEVLALTGLATVALARPGLDPPWLTLPMLAAVVSCAVCL